MTDDRKETVFSILNRLESFKNQTKSFNLLYNEVDLYWLILSIWNNYLLYFFIEKDKLG